MEKLATFVRMRRDDWRSGGEFGLEQFLNLGFVESRDFPFSSYKYRALEQIGILEHELDGLVFRRGFCFIFFSRYSGVRVFRNFSMGSSPMISRNSFLGKRGFTVLPLFEFNLPGLQETSCFAAGRSGRFVNEFDFIGHGAPAAVI
jgi:hypothetical protein